MNNCYASKESSDNYPKKYRCPINGKEYSGVKIKTLLHHIKKPWETNLIEQGYYFCDDPDCDVVYFGQDNSVIKKNSVRTAVWQKETDKKCNVCYCFGVSHKLAKEDREIKWFVEVKTKEGCCSCDTSNPSGRCCLMDFSKLSIEPPLKY